MKNKIMNIRALRQRAGMSVCALAAGKSAFNPKNGSVILSKALQPLNAAAPIV